MKRLLGRLILRLTGYKIDERTPTYIEKCVLIAAPYTSAFDVLLTASTMWAIGVKYRVLFFDRYMKFPYSLLTAPIGGLGIAKVDSKGKRQESQVKELSDYLKKTERVALVITPEGDMKRQTRWRTGFYHIALKGNVPIILGYVDHKKKITGAYAKPIFPSGRIVKDMTEIMSFYKPFETHSNSFATDARFPVA